MAPQSPSIQSFFQPEIPTAQPAVTDTDEKGNGFTTTEVKAFLYSTPHAWKPRMPYEDVQIGKLVPGPRCVRLVARIVNVCDQPSSTSKLPHPVKRCLNVLVKLWYLKVDYQLRLGQLVSIWATLISSADTSKTVSITIQNAACMVDLFPERDKSGYFMVLADRDDGTLSKTPLGYSPDTQLPGLMTLMTFIDGGHDLPTARVMLCVKSIGGRKKFTTKKGDVMDLINVMIFDDTCDATLALYGRVASSAAYWKPSHTILLLSNPGFRSDKRPTLSISANTYADVDPRLGDAEWLRSFAQRLTTREVVNVPFPEGGMQEQNRSFLSQDFMGYLSVLVLELNIMTMQQRGRIFCAECCGVPLYANTVTTICKHCKQIIALSINPRLIGTLIDETGAIRSGKLVFSDEAWEQLLGRSAEELANCDGQLLKYLENRILFLRLTLFFGWSQKDYIGYTMSPYVLSLLFPIIYGCYILESFKAWIMDKMITLCLGVLLWVLLVLFAMYAVHVENAHRVPDNRESRPIESQAENRVLEDHSRLALPSTQEILDQQSTQSSSREVQRGEAVLPGVPGPRPEMANATLDNQAPTSRDKASTRRQAGEENKLVGKVQEPNNDPSHTSPSPPNATLSDQAQAQVEGESQSIDLSHNASAAPLDQAFMARLKTKYRDASSPAKSSAAELCTALAKHTPLRSTATQVKQKPAGKEAEPTSTSAEPEERQHESTQINAFSRSAELYTARAKACNSSGSASSAETHIRSSRGEAHTSRGGARKFSSITYNKPTHRFQYPAKACITRSKARNYYYYYYNRSDSTTAANGSTPQDDTYCKAAFA
ncbi:MAG: hypothetical protein Q9168_003168 [Polycauliona sp. 1 TL-2023]